ncbi:MAG: M48 family metallopeptidase [Oscillospiraceae bacterium]|nr:M48 family metallopeptidase [Oscillospiraceae bacterium]
MEYKVIRHHKRRKLVLTVSVDGKVTVKAGIFTSDKYIETFVNSKKDWIEKQQQYFADKYHHRIQVTKEERDNLKKQLLPDMEELVFKYSRMMNVKPKSVKITVAEKRWGSCGRDGAICFSYRAALVSQKCREYLVVHELCHIKHFNHSKDFYNEIEKYIPDYRDAEKELDGYYIHIEE